MDKGGEKPKTYVSTFQLALRPRHCVKKQKNGLDTSKRTITGNNKLERAHATDGKHVTFQRMEAPCFKESLRDLSICDGGDATFHGVITGSELLSVSWLHNGVELNSCNASFKNSLATLTVRQCSAGNAGVYTCVAENGAGRRSCSAVLQVTAAATQPPSRTSNHRLSSEEALRTSNENNDQSSTADGKNQHTGELDKGQPTASSLTAIRDSRPPTKVPAHKGPCVEFVNPPEKVEARVGEQARLRCEFRSSSLPVACCWIYNRTKVVAGGPRTAVRIDGTQSSVEISQALLEDSGSYTFVVRTRHGSARHTVSLSVVDRPAPPSSQPVVSSVSSQSLVLSWTGPGYDGGTAVLGYIVEVSQEGSDKSGSWTAIGRSKNTSYHICSGLEALKQYRFRVKAYNSAGTSEPSQESVCVRMATSREKKEESEPYVMVTIDTKHKVNDHYNVHEKLGVGKFGQVFRMTHKITGQECAGKFYRARVSKDKAAARKEMQIMNKLHHPKLVRCLAAYDTRSEMALIMEYIAGGELFKRIVDENFEHTEPTSARYMKQILEGMQYVHKQNIIHLDLKPENIVCVDPSGTRIKIIDFGLACELDPTKDLTVMHGTPEFVAPEVINFEPVGLETDMWSIGVICFILLSGESPFQGNNDAETLALVTAAQYEFDPESFEDISDEAKDFISSLLKKNKRGRMSCTEALAHSWMASFTPLTRRPTKSLNKEKMKRFLARRKWKKAGKAVLALKRMTNLSNRPDSPGHSLEEPGWSREAEEAIQSLDKQLQMEPHFQLTLKDVTLPKGATTVLTCLVDGYPRPEVKWLHDNRPLSELRRAVIMQHEDGLCVLVLDDLMPSDSGVYVCRARNELGEAKCSAKLNVER
ncbi:myosin light chain kinase, smooth muscle isoform X2 [Nothobranchius furzeri]|uniref:Transcript variant X2 n=1 Tax=Nothobranchius furzeri TaxID=105023 RepID=A0A9D2XL68_NOTFU|nr:myosin light chain kinase, smooth muscle isoform X2 [Nothobranchius furzeri]KAF7204301.1 transcript variant X2 [Nothobranchius furzeri]